MLLQLDELVERLFPEPYAERSQQIADETSAAVASAAALAASTPSKAPVAHAVDIVLPPAETSGALHGQRKAFSAKPAVSDNKHCGLGSIHQSGSHS